MLLESTLIQTKHLLSSERCLRQSLSLDLAASEEVVEEKKERVTWLENLIEHVNNENDSIKEDCELRVAALEKDKRELEGNPESNPRAWELRRQLGRLENDLKKSKMEVHRLE